MKRLNLIISLLIILPVLMGCGAKSTETPTQVGETAIEEVEQTVVAEGEQTSEEEPTISPADSQVTPAIGGTLVIALPEEPDTLDTQRSTSSVQSLITKLVGGAVLSVDPVSDEYVPYLAESYSISEDGLLWEIKFKEGLKYHDGTPFKAADYAWTMQRVLEKPSPATGAMTDGMVSAEAVDDTTVQIHMGRPNSGMMYGLTTNYMQPLPKAYIETVGDEEFGRKPIGLGPFIFKEWKTGEKIVLERNPEFTWGPSFTQGIPPYIQTIELRIIPENSTRMAGLETGEIDIAFILNKDIERIQSHENLSLSEYQLQAVGPFLQFNLSKPPFDDLLVRKAINLGINRENLVKAVALGYGEPLWGPVTPSTFYYWKGCEDIGYGYDPEAAKELLKEAGYSLNSAGVMEKDGQKLEFVLKTTPSGEPIEFSKAAEILQQQLKELGISIEIEILEYGVLSDALNSGDYDLSIATWTWAEATILFPLFHSSMIGAMNESHLNDPELDPILMQVITASNQDDLREALEVAQEYLITHAYTAPLIISSNFIAHNNRVHDTLFRFKGAGFELYDAYIETTGE